MNKPKNAFEVFRLLDQSNCRECGEKTCLAFAGAVFLGQRRIDECPKLNRETLARFEGEPADAHGDGENPEEILEKLKSELSRVDLKEAAERVGAGFSGGSLSLKVLGKDFGIDAEGNIHAEIHVNPWVAMPFLVHVLSGRGLRPTGRWVTFRDLRGGRELHPLFQKRCEEPMKRVADLHTDLFDHMVHVFSGRKVDKEFESDVSVVLHPLPRVPVMICYWLPEDGLESSLHLFFDETADRNLNIGAIFTLGTGIAQMFTRISLRHGFAEGFPNHPK